jgi:hypothetical protein
MGLTERQQLATALRESQIAAGIAVDGDGAAAPAAESPDAPLLARVRRLRARHARGGVLGALAAPRSDCPGSSVLFVFAACRQAAPPRRGRAAAPCAAAPRYARHAFSRLRLTA